jgi:hypothetical protein
MMTGGGKQARAGQSPVPPPSPAARCDGHSIDVCKGTVQIDTPSARGNVPGESAR